MYRLQLVAITTAAVFVAAVWGLNIRIVKLDAPELSVVPFGYNYDHRPLSGAVYEISSDFRLTKLTFLLNGKRHGPEFQWYHNGRRLMEHFYRLGVEHGTGRAWFANGAVRHLKHFVNGKPHGEFFDWHPNGQLAQFVLYEDGVEIAAKSWTPRGLPFYNYVWRENQRVGLEGDTFCSPKKVRN